MRKFNLKEKAAERVKRVYDVLVDGRITEEDGTEICVGRTAMDAPDVDGLMFFRAKGRMPMSGDIVRVRVTQAAGYDLSGKEI